RRRIPGRCPPARDGRRPSASGRSPNGSPRVPRALRCNLGCGMPWLVSSRRRPHALQFRGLVLRLSIGAASSEELMVDLIESFSPVPAVGMSFGRCGGTASDLLAPCDRRLFSIGFIEAGQELCRNSRPLPDRQLKCVVKDFVSPFHRVILPSTTR